MGNIHKIKQNNFIFLAKLQNLAARISKMESNIEKKANASSTEAAEIDASTMPQQTSTDGNTTQSAEEGRYKCTATPM